MFELFQITAEYSNAVLLAIMPYVADYSHRLDLPVLQPVTVAQVKFFGCSPRSDHIGGRIILTNGMEFSYDRGRVALFRTPRSYFSLQDPDRIPAFYGRVKITAGEALKIAHETIKKLGYTQEALYANRKPEITEPPKFGKDTVPRYRIRWKTIDDSQNTSIDLEVDATTKQIQMMNLLNTNTWRPDPKIGVRPPSVGRGPQTTYRGGRKILPVSQAYSNAFLVAILPQLSNIVKQASLPIRLPISVNDVDTSRYICGLVEDDPMAVVYLKNGFRFNYHHGQFTAFYANDAFHIPGDKEGRVEDLFGKDNTSVSEVIYLVRKTFEKLGYSVKALRIDGEPQVVPPRRYGTNIFARYFITWQEPNQGAFLATAEVDSATKTVKALYINDRVNTNIWRVPPKVTVPIAQEDNVPMK